MRFPVPALVATGAAAVLALSACGFTPENKSSQQPVDTNQRIVVDNFRAPVAGWGLETDSAYILSLAGCLETLTRY